MYTQTQGQKEGTIGPFRIHAASEASWYSVGLYRVDDLLPTLTQNTYHHLSDGAYRRLQS
jgi:hypothetical protein